MEEPRNIVRIDIIHRNTHGWQVRVTRQRHRHTKFFSDVRFGGSDGAFVAAQHYRDHLIEKLPDALRGSEVAAMKRSTSGVPGIRLSFDDGVARIEADTLTADGQRKVRKFSVRKWGLRKALWEACKWKALIREAQAPPDHVHQMYETAYPEIKRQLTEAIEA
jgi:hypothetical protein